MNMKKLMTIVVATISMATFAKGIYFVSGGDFRECHIKYTLTTENDNETVELTPTSLRTLAISSANAKFNVPWSVKCNGIETTFLGTDCINQGSSGSGNPGEPVNATNVGATNVFPLTMSFPTPSTKIVRVYDEKYNIYQLLFKANPALTSLYVDFEQSSSASSKFSAAYCTNLTSIVYANTKIGETRRIEGYDFVSLPNLVNLEIKNPERFLVVGQGAFNVLGMTNDLVFVNVTNLAKQTFKNLPNVHYASFPNVEVFGEQALNNGAIGAYDTKHQNLGLYRLRIGDKITKIGQNCFYGHENLRTIEYVTDEVDWIGKWNSSILANVIGTAIPVDGNPNEATIQPISGADGTYYTGVRRVGCNAEIVVKIVVVRRGE